MERYVYKAYCTGGTWRVTLLNPQDDIPCPQTIAIGPGLTEDKAKRITDIMNEAGSDHE